MITEIKILVLL